MLEETHPKQLFRWEWELKTRRIWSNVSRHLALSISLDEGEILGDIYKEGELFFRVLYGLHRGWHQGGKDLIVRLS